MLRAGFALAALIGLAAPAAAAAPSPDPKTLAVPAAELSKARALVQKLGSEAFADREAAERDLAAMGRAARAALLDGASVDPDPEVRARCRTLLPKATAAEMKARLDTFLADAGGKYEHDLPGWNRLRAVVRGEWPLLGWTFAARPAAGPAARALFVEFLAAPEGRKLLTAVGTGDDDLATMVAERKQQLYYMRTRRVPGVVPRTPGAMEVAVVVFADSQAEFKSAGRSNLFTSVMTSSGFLQATKGSDEKAAALRAVLAAWFDTRTDPMEMYYALSLANSTQDENAAGRLAVRLLGTAGAPGYHKGQALTTLVRLKRADQLPALEKAFADNSVLSNATVIVNGVRVVQPIEVRDAALAAALLLSDQSPTDYGFVAFPKVPPGTFSYSYARITEDKRKEAFAKWQAWREKNP